MPVGDILSSAAQCPYLSEMLTSSPTAEVKAAQGTQLRAGFALVFKIPHISLFTLLRNVPLKAAGYGPFRRLKSFIYSLDVTIHQKVLFPP